MARLRGNVSLLNRLLRSFAAEGPTMTNETATLLRQTKWTEAARKIHALKGIAGNLGIVAVHQTAQALEEAMSRPERDYAAPLAALTETTARITQAIETALPSPSPAPQPHREPEPKGMSVELTTALEELLLLLDKADFAARRHFADIAAELHALVPKQAKGIKETLAQFDFSGAKDIVLELLRNFPTSKKEQS